VPELRLALDDRAHVGHGEPHVQRVRGEHAPAHLSRTDAISSSAPARFTPLRRASRRKRVAVILIGPFLWVLAIHIAALVATRADTIGLGLAIAGFSFCLALIWQILWRRRRISVESD
jgi:hypothetical protein